MCAPISALAESGFSSRYAKRAQRKKLGEFCLVNGRCPGENIMVEPSEPAAQTDDEKAPCPVCGEPISPKALKCIHCASYLASPRFFIVWNTALALLIALPRPATTASTLHP